MAATVKRRSVQHAVYLDQPRVRLASIRAALKCVENLFLAGQSDAENGSAAARILKPANGCGAIEYAININQLRLRIGSIGTSTGETVQNGLLAACGYAENSSAAIFTVASEIAASARRAVERTIHVDQPGCRTASVRAARTLKCIHHFFRAGRAHAINCSIARRAPVLRRAVQRTVHVEQSRLRISPIGDALEAVEHLMFAASSDAVN